MYCSNCGKLIADDARFCSFCGTKVSTMTAQEPAPAPAPSIEPEAPAPAPVPEVQPAPVIEPAPAPVAEPAPAPVVEPAPAPAEPERPADRDPIFDEFKWNVSEYPTGDARKTEDINFDWSADPSTIVTGGLSEQTAAEIRVKADLMEAGEPVVIDTPAPAAPADAFEAEPGSVAARIDQFYTINSKNEEFQKLLNKEYEKVKSGNVLVDEQTAADSLADERFETRPQDTSMEAFLESEGIEKPYEPPAFESDVLKRIEAQEKAKERKRLEEEALEKALEEARLEAVAKKQEEAAKLAAEVEAARQAEEEARAKAEADRMAAQEAEKIRQQREARQAAEVEAARQAEEERRRYEEERLKAKLEQERQELSRKAETAAAAEEARRVLEHTTRMREEEAAKIKAAIAGLRGEFEKATEETAAAAEPVAPAPVVEPAPAPVAEPTPAPAVAPAPAPAEPVVPIAGLVEPTPAPAVEPAPAPVVEPAPAPAVEPTPAPVAEPAPAPAEEIEILQFAPEDDVKTVDRSAFKAEVKTPEVPEEVAEAHQATQDQINEMAKARDTYFATFYGEDDLREQMKAEAQKKPEPAPAVAEPTIVPQPEPAPAPVAEPEPVRMTAEELSRTRVIDKSAVLAGLETTRRISKAEMRAQEDKEFFESLEAAAPAPAPAEEPGLNLEFKDNGESVDELLSQLEGTAPAGVDPFLAGLPDAEPEEPAPAPIPEPVAQPIVEGFAPKEEPAVVPEVMPAEDNSRLSDTMVMPGRELEADNLMDDFNNYGVEEAENFKKQQEMQAAPAVEEPPVPMDEDIDEDEDDEEEKKGGVGRLILKIILILLVVIFAAELAGIGIKFLAPDSGAAKGIDNQLNKVIHLITGDENADTYQA